MAFNGYLFKFGNYTFPLNRMKIDTYRVKPNQRQNLDAYTDGNGVTHTNPLKHTKTQVTFTTMKMTGAQMDVITENIVANYRNYSDRNANCSYYDSENRKYKTGEFYLDQSLEFPINKISKDKRKIEEYGEMTWTFIEK